MEEINDLEEYSKFIEMLVTVTATDSQLMDFMQEEKDYKENLQLIRALLTDRSYSSLLTPADWQKILNFVGDCRYTMPNITEEQFLACNQMIGTINEYIKTVTAAIQIYGSTYKIQVDENVNDYSNILKNNSYEKLTSYLHQQYNQEQKKLEKR